MAAVVYAMERYILVSLEYLLDELWLYFKPKDKIKLCDFGSCSDIKNGFRETFCGTFEYMAPEMIKELPYNQGVDIWSLGVLLYEMIHGFSPFFNKSEDKTQKRDLSQIFKNILTNKLEFKAGLSEECKSLIKSELNLIKFLNGISSRNKSQFRHDSRRNVENH